MRDVTNMEIGRKWPRILCLGVLTYLLDLTASFEARAATFVVTTTNHGDAGSLRQAILDANAATGADTITFAITNTALTIIPTNALPDITDPVTIDGTTQPGFSNAPTVELRGSSAGAGADGLRVLAGQTTIRGLVINRFAGDGLELSGGGTNVVEGCIIGLGVGGTADQGNTLQGILITNSPANRIGGTNASERNWISGNNQSGVYIAGTAASNNVVLGNVIGLGVTGTDLGNSQNGVFIAAPRNTIGGVAPGARNVISGNASDGIELSGTNASVNVIQGNLIGTDSTGILDLGNSSDGILVNGAPANLIGGSGPGAGNLISGNNASGVELTGLNAAFNVIQGNSIGVTTSGRPRGNTVHGIYLTANARTNTLGGAGAGEGNTIAYNGADGIYVNTGTNNAVRANAIFSNSGLGIDIGGNGVTPNDAGDGDTGANQLQNFPVLAAATNSLTDVVIAGTLNSKASTTCALDFFSNVSADPTTNGEGQAFLGSTNVTTDAGGNASFAVALPGPINGRNISATATDPFGNTSEFSTCVRAASVIAPATFIVSNTNDSGAGSLRQAILDSNNRLSLGANTIAFNIAGAGPQTIMPVTGLPTIIEPVNIDGCTQPGTATNTLAQGFDAVILIQLDGVNAGADADGLNLACGGNLVRGLDIIRFDGQGIELAGGRGSVIAGNIIGLDLDGTDHGNVSTGIYLNGSAANVIGGLTPAERNVISGNGGNGLSVSAAGATGNLIAGNFIGTDFTGALDRGNTGDGVSIDNGAGNLIGGGSDAARNIISGNDGQGIQINNTGATNNLVLGNFIGLDVSGSLALANSSHGVYFSASARGNFIGGTNSGEPNIIAFNGGDGVYVETGAANALRANSIFSNTGLGIDLNPNGVTANDVGDPDTGANLRQNFPLLAAATAHTNRTEVAGTLNTATNSAFVIDFFSSYVADGTGYGEGQKYLGSTNVTTDGAGNAAFSLTLPAIVQGRFISATATDTNGNTSEFSPVVVAASTIPPVTLWVVNTNDSGAGSLRQALLDNNCTVGATNNTIHFNIPGAGPHVIAPASALPAVVESVTLDGFTQPGSSANTLAAGCNADWRIVLDGASAGSGVDGLRLQADHCVVRGLAIRRFTSDGIEATRSGHVIEGNLIGLALDGADLGNTANGIFLNGSSNDCVGGAAPAARNVISGNNSDGIEALGAAATGNVISGNFIGTDIGGTLDRGNTSVGVLLSDAPTNIVGGSSIAARNIIAGNNSHGVSLSGVNARGNRMLGNFIGTDVSGTLDLGNGADGVSLTDCSFNFIGGAAAGEGNVISGNTSDGVSFSGLSATNNVVLGNRIGTDASGTSPLANSAAGVYFVSSARFNQVGGPGAGEANLIAFNTGDGIFVSAGTNNALRANAVHSNGGLGIDLGANGVQTNDVSDADTGANQLQNYPFLTSALAHTNRTEISGTLDSRASASFALDFFCSYSRDGTGFGEGQKYLGSTNVTTDGAGAATFNVTLPLVVEGRQLTATATDADGNTSEFSPCLAAGSTIPPQTFWVVNTNDSGAGSLRQALLDNNQTVSATCNTIRFNIPDAGPLAITPLTALPTVTEAATIDGFTQPGTSPNTLADGCNAVWRIVLDGGPAFLSAPGLHLAANGCVVRGLVIIRFADDGIWAASSGNAIEGNLIGLSLDGAAIGNGSSGVLVTGGSTNRVGGTTPAARNVISGNTENGVALSGTTSAGNVVLGNFIGTDVAGTLERGNGDNGVGIVGSVSNIVGGATAGARNVIAASRGLDAGSGMGVYLQNTRHNAIQGNFIGTDVTGTRQLGNIGGVRFDGNCGTNWVGGAAAGEGNVISGNSAGIMFFGANVVGNRVQGNLIGTDVTGMVRLPNWGYGIGLIRGSFNLIGGPGAGNLISGNASDGVSIQTTAVEDTGNVIQGNRIGTDVTGTTALGNSASGVYVAAGRNTLLGGTNAGEGNIIAFNAGSGVNLYSGSNICIRGNSIHSDGSLGIDLGQNGVTPNDAGDADAGPNGLQNFPVLTLAYTDGTNTSVRGRFNGATNASFDLDFYSNPSCHSSGYGEGRVFLGSSRITTDDSGNATFAASFAMPSIAEHRLTATATDTNGNTSEFSACRRIVPFDTVDLQVTLKDSADPVALVSNLTYTVTVTNLGPGAATDIVLTNTLPPQVAFLSALPTQGVYAHTNGIVVWQIGPLAMDQGARADFFLHPTTTGWATNLAWVSCTATDHTSTNNSAKETTRLGIADILVALTDGPDPIVAGQTLTLTATVSNLGPDTATSVATRQTLPGSLVPQSATLSQGSASAGLDWFTFGTIPAGGVATATLTAMPRDFGVFTNIIQRTSLNEFDPGAANDIARAPTTVLEGPGILWWQSSYDEVVEGGTVANYVRRRGGTIGTVSVDYLAVSGSATVGSDCPALSGTLTFTNGETLKEFLVPTTDDALQECNEEFSVRLINPAGGAVLAPWATNLTVLIQENDRPQVGSLTLLSRVTPGLGFGGGNGDSEYPAVNANGRFIAFESDADSLATNDWNNGTDVFLRDLLLKTTTLISVNSDGTESAWGDSEDAAISADGTRVFFHSDADDLVASAANGREHLFVRDVLSGQTLLVDTDAAGTGVGESYADDYVISSNGWVAAFDSPSTNLSVLDNNGCWDVFVRNLSNAAPVLVSVNLAGTASGNGDSTYPAISRQGNHVAFESDATDLVTNDANVYTDVFVRDLVHNTTMLASINRYGTGGGNGASYAAWISADGRYVAFKSAARNLTTNVVSSAQLYWRDLAAGETRLASVQTNGINGISGSVDVMGLSADGRYVLFETTATNLTSLADGNRDWDVFVRDMFLGVTTLVSVNEAGTAAGNDASYYSCMSDDGRFVTWLSEATDLAPGAEPDYHDVFTRDLLTGVTRLMSPRVLASSDSDVDECVISGNGQVTVYTSGSDDLVVTDQNNYDVFARTFGSSNTVLVSVAPSVTGSEGSYNATVSANGHVVAFVAYAANLTPNDTNDCDDVFVADLTTGELSLASRNHAGTGPGNYYSEDPSLSGDGRYLAFASAASDLVSNDDNDAGDVFLRDQFTGALTLVSMNASNTAPANWDSDSPRCSADGRRIVFRSWASDLVALPDTNGRADLFVRDTAAQSNILVTVNTAGTGAGNADSSSPSISSNGQVVAFLSYATNLTAWSDPNANADVFVRDLASQTTWLASINQSHTAAGNRYSTAPVLSDDGRRAAFASYASDLVPGDANDTRDVFVFDRQTGSNTLVSVNRYGTGSGNGVSDAPQLSADGRHVVFTSAATDLTDIPDYNGATDVFVRDLVADTTTLVSVDCTGAQAADGASSSPAISADGRYVLFLSRATDVVPGIFDGTQNALLRDLQTGTTTLVSFNRANSGGGDGSSYTVVSACLSADGSVAVFCSDADDLITDDRNACSDVFVWRLAALPASADLALTTVVSPAVVPLGGQLTYTVCVTNRGPTNATSVLVTDTLPAGVSFVSATNTGGICARTNQVVTCSVASLAVNEGAAIIIVVNTMATGTLVNEAIASASQPDYYPLNNQASAAALVNPYTTPGLSVVLASNLVFICWPSTAAGFVLETKTNLNSAVPWTAATNVVTDNGTWRTAVVSPNHSEPARYYRLHYLP